jgi:NADH-quinone oxidoreductase subunit J
MTARTEQTLAGTEQTLAGTDQTLARAGKAPWVVTLALALLLAAVGPWLPGGTRTAYAQAPAQPGQVQDAHGQADAAGAPAGAPAQFKSETFPLERAAAAGPSLTDDSPGAAVFFWLFALMVVGGSVFVITRRNLISAVMGMVGTFFAIAAVFTMLYAHFLSAIQVLVYAGAIMVLFVFVIMIMNKPEDHPWGRVGTFGNIVAAALIAYLVYRIGIVLWNVPVEPRMVAPPPQVAISQGTVEHMVDFGTTKAIGDSLFHEYLFPFEAVSLVLLIAVVGALAVARPHEKSPAATPSTPSSNA